MGPVRTKLNLGNFEKNESYMVQIRTMRVEKRFTLGLCHRLMDHGLLINRKLMNISVLKVPSNCYALNHPFRSIAVSVTLFHYVSLNVDLACGEIPTSLFSSLLPRYRTAFAETQAFWFFPVELFSLTFFYETSLSLILLV